MSKSKPKHGKHAKPAVSNDEPLDVAEDDDSTASLVDADDADDIDRCRSVIERQDFYIVNQLKKFGAGYGRVG